MNQNEPLFTVGHKAGRHEKMLAKAIEEGRASQRITTLDDGLVSLAIANAAALDAAEASGKSFYPVAQLTGPYREVLEALRMTPKERDTDADSALTAAIAELGTATVRNP